MKYLSKQTRTGVSAGIVIGVLLLMGVRFATYSPEHIHYHANFLAYINGKKETFSSPLYFEEKGGASCNVSKIITPNERAHMHDEVPDVVHVHDHAVTWGQFFQNLHWAVGDGFIKTPDAMYLADDTHQVQYLINGHAFQDISNELIHDRDRLVVDYGDTSEKTLQKEYQSVPSTAKQYDEGKDPAACKGSQPASFNNRLHHLL